MATMGNGGGIHLDEETISAQVEEKLKPIRKDFDKMPPELKQLIIDANNS